MSPISFVFINGKFAEAKSTLHSLPTTIEYRSTDGLFLHIPKNQELLEPIYLKFLNDGKQISTTALNNTIIIEENSKVTLIEEYSAMNAEHYTVNVATEVQLKKHARMDYYKLQYEHHTAMYQSNIVVQQQESSQLQMFNLDVGSLVSDVDLRVKLNERYAACYLHGLYLLNSDQQQLSNAIHIDHIAEYGTSSMFYKGVLANKSRALFNGKVHVHKEAEHANAYQANHNLLLSPDAEVKTQPQLEIYAEDIKCTHGATVGQLDDESLFYLRSRGILKDAAFKLLTHAFTAEVLNKIADPDIRHYIQQRVSQYEEL